MAKERDDVELALHIEMESKKAIRGLAQISKGIDKIWAKKKLEIKLDQKGTVELGKQLREQKKYSKAMEKALRNYGSSKLINETKKAFQDLQYAEDKLSKEIAGNAVYLSRLRKKLSQATTKDETERLSKELALDEKKLEQSVKIAEAEYREKKKILERGLKEPGAARALGKQAKLVDFQKSLDEVSGTDLGKDIGESFADAVERLSGKDLLGLAKGGGKLSAAILKGLGKRSLAAGKGVEFGGAMGGLMKSVGPLVSTLSKLGPILSAVAGSFGAIVKLLTEVEGAAKEMNKQILEGASTLETLQAAGGRAGAGFQRLEETTAAVRAAATDISNVKWGLNKDDVVQTINAIAQAGVPLESMRKSFEIAGKSAAEGFSDVARMSLAWSRTMGVSMQEITDFQAEMFTEMGQGLSNMQLQFGRMTKDATDSGIATNKFFSILRSVSTDLNLYTTRVEQAAHVLKLLGKVMNPRDAQKFMQMATQGLKGMSDEDRVRHTLLVGEKEMRDILIKDLERKKKKMAVDLGFSGEVKSLEQLEGLLDKVTDEKQRGAIQSAITEMRLDEQAIKSGGTVGLSEAAANASMGAVLASFEKIAQKFGGTKDLSKLTGLQGLAARKASGKSLEEFRSMAKLQASLESERAKFVKALEQQPEGDLAKRLKSEGFDSLEKINKMGTDDIIAMMDQSASEAAAQNAEVVDYTKKTSDLTTTMLDKVGIIVDGIFNYLYEALKGIISAINRAISLIPGGGRENIREELEGKGGVSAKLADIVRGQDVGSQRQVLLTTLDKAAAKAFGGTKDEKGQKEFAAKLTADLDKLFHGTNEAQSANLRKMVGSSVDPDRLNKFLQLAATSGKGVGFAVEQSGLTPAEILKIFQKSLYLQTDDIADTISGLQSTPLLVEQAGPVPAGTVPVGTSGLPTGAAALSAATARVEAAKAAEAAKVSNQPGPLGASAPVVTTATGIAASPIVPVSVAPPSEGGVIAEQVDLLGKETVSNLQQLYDAMRRRGIVLDKNQLDGPIKNTIRDGTLEAAQQALAEFALYTSTDTSRTLSQMKASGFQGASRTAQGYEAFQASQLPKKADGGRVVGIAAGRAVFAPPGEGLTSIGPGERITPAGRGGGGSVTVNVNGIGGADLANYLKEKIAQGIYEYKRREKFQ